MPERVFRVALVGCGGMGRHHLSVLNPLPDFEIAALCDVSGDAVNRSGEQFGVSARFTDVDKMLDDTELDIVTVATQTRHHHVPTVAALRRGVSVLCEKPISIDLAEADEMVMAAKESGAKFSIHQQNYEHPGVRKAEALVREGLIGDVNFVRGRNKMGRKSGNEFMEMGTHVTGMMLGIGGVPAWCAGTIYAEKRLAESGDIMEAKEMSPGDRDSGLVMGTRAIAQYGFQSGVLGEIHFLGILKGFNANYGMDIIGSVGQLAVRVSGDMKQTLWHLPRPLEGSPAQAADWKLVDLSDVGVEEPMVRMYRGLAEAIEKDTEPPSGGVEGRWAFEMVMGIYASHIADGRRMELPLAERRHPLELWRKA